MDVQVAEDEQKMALFSLFPQFVSKAEYNYLTQAMQISTPMGLMNMGSNKNYSVNAGFNWTIFAGGRLHIAYKIYKNKIV